MVKMATLLIARSRYTETPEGGKVRFGHAKLSRYPPADLEKCDRTGASVTSAGDAARVRAATRAEFRTRQANAVGIGAAA